MKGFIEVTDVQTGRKNLINVSSIEVIADEGTETSICIISGESFRKITHYVVTVAESYWEVKEQVSRAMGEG